MNKPELLAPAGSFASLQAAIRYGADAIYVGGSLLQLRAKSAAFSLEELAKAASYAHQYGKKLYVTVNALAKCDEIDLLKIYANDLHACGVDAAIVSDLGVLVTMHEACPALELHVSTQASCQNHAAALTYYRLGAKRIVLAREMTIEEIRKLSKQIPEDLELEAFVHGAMCMAVSGRCILSSALLGRSGNRGECAQPCRWQYHRVEETRPNQVLPIEQEGQTTAILSSRDLNCIELLDELQDAGVSSLKIEGRMKTEYYTAVTVNAYRHAIDHTAPTELLQHELETISHRPYTTGFYCGELPEDHANRGTYLQTYRFCGVILSVQDNTALIEQRNRFEVGDSLELVSPFALSEKITIDWIRNEEGNPVSVANKVRQKIWIPVSSSTQPGDFLRIAAKPEKKD